METVRIPLPSLLESRDDSLEMDGLLTNCYQEENPEGMMVVKRPGTSLLIALGGIGQGAIWFGGKSIFIAGDTLYTNNYILLRADAFVGVVP